jgi:flagellar biosynthesis protein FlhF
MITRTFRAANMREAFDNIQRTLGPDALVVSVRQVPAGSVWEVWRKPEVEVVAMSKKDEGQEPKTEPRAKAPAARPPETETRAKDLAADFAQVKSTLSEVASRLDRFTLSDWSVPLGNIYRRLVAQELDEELARRVIAACTEALNPRTLENESVVREYVQQQLEAALTEPVNSAITAPVVCLVGTSGAGKTATVAKLAAHYTQTLGRRVAWICADTFRAGAIAQARIYAEALKLPLRVAYTPPELAQAVAAEPDADLILVDTPAYNPRRTSTIVELGELLTALPASLRATYLALPATAKASDALEALAASKPFDLKGLVLTKLDETHTFGSSFNVAWRSGLPLAFFTTGAEALGDLQPAQTRLLINALFGEGLAR